MSFELVSDGGSDDPFECVTEDDGGVTVYAPAGALVHIYGPEGEISRGWGCSSIRPPGAPPGVSTRELLSAFFGKK